MLDIELILRRHVQHLQFTPPQKKDVTFLLISCMAVGVGSRLGPLIQSQASLKSVAHTIKLADGFMKGASTIHKLRSPTPANLVLLALEAAKVLAKGASKGLVIKNKNACFKKIFKVLKASEGALNLVKYSSVLNYSAADPLESVIGGYKLTMSAFNVFDGVHGVGYGSIMEGMEGVGLVVKAMILYKQTHGFLIQGLRVSHELWEALRNNKIEQMCRKEKLRKRRARQRMVFALQSRNSCGPNLGLRYSLRDGGVGKGHPQQDMEGVFIFSLPCRAHLLCR